MALWRKLRKDTIPRLIASLGGHTKESDPRLKRGSNSTFTASRVAWKENCKVLVGNDSRIHAKITFEKPGAEVVIGNRTFIGSSKLVCAEKIVIGDDILISWGCTVIDHNSHSTRFTLRKDDIKGGKEGFKDWGHVVKNKITISDKSWIGFNAIILQGVTIGEGAIVGAGSVVTKDVPDWTVVAGNPARVIRKLGEDER